MPVDMPVETKSTMSKRDIAELACRPDFAEWLTQENSLEALSTLALGIALLLGSRRLVRWLHRWQTAQAQAMDEAETEVGNAPTAEPRA